MPAKLAISKMPEWMLACLGVRGTLPDIVEMSTLSAQWRAEGTVVDVMEMRREMSIRAPDAEAVEALAHPVAVRAAI